MDVLVKQVRRAQRRLMLQRFLGLAVWCWFGALLIATVRGLPQCVRDLRARLTGRVMAEEPQARPGSRAPDGVRRAPDGVRRRIS